MGFFPSRFIQGKEESSVESFTWKAGKDNQAGPTLTNKPRPTASRHEALRRGITSLVKGLGGLGRGGGGGGGQAASERASRRAGSLGRPETLGEYLVNID